MASHLVRGHVVVFTCIMGQDPSAGKTHETLKMVWFVFYQLDLDKVGLK